MKRWTRRRALGTAVALCQVPATAAPEAATSVAHQERHTRLAIDTYARAWERGDIPALLNCYHADFTLHYFGTHALAGRHVGKSASLRVLGEMRQRTGRQLKAVISLLVGADKAVMVTREALTAKGQTVEVERLYLYTVLNGQLLECWVYDQDQRLMDGLIGT